MCGFSVAVLWLENHFYINCSLNNYVKSFYDFIVLKDTQYDLHYIGIKIDRKKEKQSI